MCICMCVRSYPQVPPGMPAMTAACRALSDKEVTALLYTHPLAVGHTPSMRLSDLCGWCGFGPWWTLCVENAVTGESSW